jgi:hypothetical protein
MICAGSMRRCAKRNHRVFSSRLICASRTAWLSIVSMSASSGNHYL